MRLPLRAFALLLAVVVFGAAATPCPPEPPMRSGDASSATLEPSMRAKCPCSCSDGPAPASSSSHLDFAIERPTPQARVGVSFASAERLFPLLPAAPHAPRDTIPI